jgi:hypothetical protein
MGGIKQLDAFVLNRGSLISREPFTFGFGGIDYVATCGARDTMQSLVEGGIHHDTEFTALVESAQFAQVTAPTEKDQITVCVDSSGVPCAAEDAARRITCRIQSVTRAGGGMTFKLRTNTRG